MSKGNRDATYLQCLAEISLYFIMLKMLFVSYSCIVLSNEASDVEILFSLLSEILGYKKTIRNIRPYLF